MVLAMAFCILGDTLLMFNRGDEFSLCVGFSCLPDRSHILHFCLPNNSKEKSGRFSSVKITGCVGYMVVILWLLLPAANELKVPVVFYATVISMMLIFAVQLTKIGKFGWIIAIGALLFVISDSAIAINKFYTQFQKTDG